MLGGLDVMSEVGVTLLLFAIGLQLDLRTLIKKEVWFNAGAHMAVMTGIGIGFLSMMGVLGASARNP